jgi:putative transcriptional regulator
LHLPPVDGALIRRTRLSLGLTRAAFADRLGIKRRTLERWEQARSLPGPEASALILLVREFGDTLERLASLDTTRPRGVHAGRTRIVPASGGRLRQR